MKINGPGQPAAPDVPASEAADRASKVRDPARPTESPASGKAFADKLQGVGSPDAARALDAPGTGQVPRPGLVTVDDLAAELRTGTLTPAAAIDKVVERVVARQVGPDAPTSVRDQVRMALRDAVENDPLLAEKLTRLR